MDYRLLTDPLHPLNMDFSNNDTNHPHTSFEHINKLASTIPNNLASSRQIAASPKIIMKLDTSQPVVDTYDGLPLSRTNSSPPVTSGKNAVLQESDEPGVPESGRPKYMNNKRILLTYGSRRASVHLHKEDFITAVTDLAVRHKNSISFIRLAHEYGTHDEGEDPYLHTHIAIEFGKNLQSTNSQIFDYMEGYGFRVDKKCHIGFLHPHCRYLISKAHWDNSLKYLAKEDPDNADLLINAKNDTPEFSVAALHAYATPADMLSAMITNKSDVKLATQYLAIYNCRPNKLMGIQKDPITLTGWQIPFFHEINNTPGKGRQIIWINDSIGGSGKSWLIDHCFATNPSKYYMIGPPQGLPNTMNITMNALKAGWTGDTIFMNLTRSSESYKNTYECIEALIDGQCYNTKYIGGTYPYKACRVIVMANWMPLVSALTTDRWDIRRLSPISTPFVPGPDTQELLRVSAYDLLHSSRNITDFTALVNNIPPL
ncbi:replication-associated protein [Crucivirus-275]|nr:replication-associated protein [Crucivirus-275]